jgi:prepilin-type N-terminal cleavage/methylation domain-containing protein
MKMSSGFTLVELLVVIVSISILLVIGFISYNGYLESAKKTKEIHAARALIAGFHAYAADNNGRLLEGMSANPKGVVDDKGKPVMSHAAKRYAWRIAPYIDYNVDSILLVNNTEAAPKNDPMYSYLVTVYTTFGINAINVGGNFNGGMSPDNPRARARYGNFCVRNIMQAHNPSKLVVFATAKMHDAPHRGAFDVSSNGTGTTGKVDYRYNKKAIVANFAGNVELLDESELKDMRRWSNVAAMQDNPNWSF